MTDNFPGGYYVCAISEDDPESIIDVWPNGNIKDLAKKLEEDFSTKEIISKKLIIEEYTDDLLVIYKPVEMFSKTIWIKERTL